MTTDEVRELVDRGHEIGCHTISHPRLEQLTHAELEREIVDAKLEVETVCGTTVTGLCYPDGFVDDRVVATVRRAGYESACTTVDGVNDGGTNPYRLRRFDVTTHRTSSNGKEHDPLLFEGEISGFHKMLGR